MHVHSSPGVPSAGSHECHCHTPGLHRGDGWHEHAVLGQDWHAHPEQDGHPGEEAEDRDARGVFALVVHEAFCFSLEGRKVVEDVEVVQYDYVSSSSG